MNFVLWLLPLLVLILSFVSFRVNAFKASRYKIYVLLLFIAFLFDLMHLSFTNDIIDTVRFFLVTFIISDILWNVTKIRKPKVRATAVIVGLVAFGWVFSRWVIDGPNKNSMHWMKPVVSSYVNHKNRNYVLKEEFESGKKPVKRLSLLKIKKVKLLEEEVRTYELPEGYANSDFNYQWSNTQNGVRLDLVNGKDTVWTLGEGF